MVMLHRRENTCAHFGIFLSFSMCTTNFCLKLYYIFHSDLKYILKGFIFNHIGIPKLNWVLSFGH